MSLPAYMHFLAGSLAASLVLGCGPSGARISPPSGARDGETDWVARLVATDDTSLVIIVDPATCLSCDVALATLLERRRQHAPVYLVLTRGPTEIERKHLALSRVRADTTLALGAVVETGVVLVVARTSRERLTMSDAVEVLEGKVPVPESSSRGSTTQQE